MSRFGDFLDSFADFFTPESPQERARRNRSKGQKRRRRRERIQPDFTKKERRRGSREFGDRETDAPPPPDEPPRRRTKYDDPSRDPYYEIYKQTAFKGNRSRPGYLEHKDIFDMYADALDWDEQRRRNLWAEYGHFMVSDRSTYLRKDPNNPFWQHSGISPDSFDWDAWRHAMGDSPRRK